MGADIGVVKLNGFLSEGDTHVACVKPLYSLNSVYVVPKRKKRDYTVHQLLALNAATQSHKFLDMHLFLSLEMSTFKQMPF